MDTRETFVLIPEQDKAILGTLPKEGARLGWKPLALQVRAIAGKLGEGATGAQVAGRMMVLRHHEYVVDAVVQPVAKGKGYQITKKGEGYLNGSS